MTSRQPLGERPSRSPGVGPAGRLLVLVAALLLATSAPVAAQAGDPGAGTSVATTPRLATPILSARRVPELLVSQVAAERVAEVADEVVELAPSSSCLVVHDGGQVVYEANPDQPLIPASNQKLLTAVALLDRLGADHRSVTTAAATDDPGDGVVDGDLYLIGGGDPLLLTEGYRPTLTAAEERLGSDFDELADAIVDAGVTEVRGDVVGDDSRYDDERYVPSWPERYQRQDTVGPLSALSVNDGVTGLTDEPDRTNPNRVPGDPPSLAAQTLVSLLEDRGVEVTGDGVAGEAPASAQELARHESPPLSQVLEELLGWSDNYAAELLTRELDVAAGGAGSTPGGLAEVREVLAERGLPLEGVELVDGSGLDLGNRVSCRLLVGLLDQELASGSPLVVDALAVAGEEGTLHERMVGSPAQGRVRAKTGTLNSVMSLAGVVDTVPGDQVTFAFVMNVPPEGDPDATTALQDRLVEELVTYPDVPDPATLAPAPPG